MRGELRLCQKLVLAEVPHGEQLTKTEYDRIGRATRSFTLAKDNDSAYSEVLTLTGDYVLERRLDTGGRLWHIMATTVISGFDSAVVRQTYTYTARGQVDTVTQFSSTTVGSPDTSNITDQLQHTYDDWGNVATFTQDPDSGIGASGRAAYTVSYTYAKNTSGRNTIRRTKMTYPNATELLYDYLVSGPRMDAQASRVTRLRIGFVSASASYLYNGLTRTVSDRLDVVYGYNETADMATHGSFLGLDRFGRRVLAVSPVGPRPSLRLPQRRALLLNHDSHSTWYREWGHVRSGDSACRSPERV